MSSAKSRILDLLLANVGQVVIREEIRVAAGRSEWARRIRDLRQEGWEIETVSEGYVLQSPTPTGRIRKRESVSRKQRYQILHRDNSRCRRCGRSVDDGVKLVIDHVVPLDWGGSNDDSNLWTLCEDCNSGKKAWQSDADAEAMRNIFHIKGARNRLKAYLVFKSGIVCTRQELQIVSGIAQYARRIRELREQGMNIKTVGTRGDYVYDSQDDP